VISRIILNDTTKETRESLSQKLPPTCRVEPLPKLLVLANESTSVPLVLALKLANWFQEALQELLVSTHRPGGAQPSSSSSSSSNLNLDLNLKSGEALVMVSSQKGNGHRNNAAAVMVLPSEDSLEFHHVMSLEKVKKVVMKLVCVAKGK